MTEAKKERKEDTRSLPARAVTSSTTSAVRVGARASVAAASAAVATSSASSSATVPSAAAATATAHRCELRKFRRDLLLGVLHDLQQVTSKFCEDKNCQIGLSTDRN